MAASRPPLLLLSFVSGLDAYRLLAEGFQATAAGDVDVELAFSGAGGVQDSGASRYSHGGGQFGVLRREGDSLCTRQMCW